MKKHIISMALVVAVFIAIASMSMSYADVEIAVFVDCGTDDNEAASDVGIVTADINDGGDLIINIYNAYPGYEAYVSFVIQHMGDSESLPGYLNELLIDNAYAGVEMDVTVTYLDGTPIPIDTELLQPGETLVGLVTVTMLDEADEDSSYSFSVDLSFSDQSS